ncbi:Cache domain containing protein [Nitzschia inconspicua]|uniref:Cache domain containing protein n=1 Tax=Nitzschia inconspicua TaxID=303405 RepID=A0A9K3KXI7_9STRA|nr:Cache domain containing protein [Nitzschia inconspicua]
MRFPILQRTCLRPSYSLRRQLIVAYGVTAFITILLVVVSATIAAIRAGDTVKDDVRELLTNQYIDSLQKSGKLTSEIFTKKWSNIHSTVSLLAEVVRDRIVGYPDEFADDRYVSFVDYDTGERKYPLKAALLPRDWQVTSNWNLENLEEHTQERAGLSKDLIGVMSTESAMFAFQGNCNPDHTPGESGYFPFCNEDFNNASLGGSVNPTVTLAPLEQKAADISVFLKPLWEAEPSAMSISVYFSNSGAGATIQFPSFGIHSAAEYQSSGCEWMNEINPFTNDPYGTAEERSRCSANGTMVPIRLYNPMERDFCADQALHPGELRVSGPYLDAVWSAWRLTVGEAVFDRRTGHFIACTALDVSLDLATEILDSVAVDNRTAIAITRLDGTVVAGAGTSSEFTETVNIQNTEFITEKTFLALTKDLFWEHHYNSNQSYIESIRSNIVTCDGKLYSMYTSPPPPMEHDPDFVPDFLIFTSVEVEDVFAVVNEIGDEIDSDVSKLIITTTVFGLVGLIALLGFVFVVARLLTRPLTWMESVAWQIVNHSDNRVGDTLVVSRVYHKDHLTKCIPKTEAAELVDEFESMINGFSGKGACTVASSRISELRNSVTYCLEFDELYNVNASDEKKELLRKNLIAQSVSRRMSRVRSSIAKFNPTDFEKIVEENAEFRSTEMETFEGEEDPKFSSISFANAVQSKGEPSLEIRSSTIISKKSISRVAFADSEAVDPSLRMNPGPLLAVSQEASMEGIEHPQRISRSSLFWCILLLIVVPILLCIVAISVVVALRLAKTFPDWISSARDSSFAIEFESLMRSAHLKARYAEQVMSGSIRDLHLLTRMAGWLLFGAVGRSDSFTEVEMEFVEECKVFSSNQVCPYEADEFRTPCPCEWNDPWERECQEPPRDPRSLQRLFFMCQRRDYDPITGERNSSQSFPTTDYSPETTAWWTNPNELPGSTSGPKAAGYNTTYDRLRVISALSAVSLPLYNYVNNSSKANSRTSMSSYIAYEADGSFLGYAGCNYDFARYARFQSSAENGAFLVNGDLCPEGKFGYDPRCRDWYAAARTQTLDSGETVYVTPPYKYATADDIGNTAVSSLLDPNSGDFVGTTLIDFSTNEIYQFLNRSSAGFYAVVTAKGTDQSNLVSNMSGNPESVVSGFLAYDEADSNNVRRFEDVLAEMKTGGKKSGSLTRTNEDGRTQNLFYSYCPVIFRELKPIQPGDFTRGVELSHVALYSLILAEVEEHLHSKFDAVSYGIQSDLKLTNVIFLVVTAVITLICILVTARISVLITKPMVSLLNVVRSVNEGRIGDVLPPLNGGSREVHQVYTSFAKLYKILQISNSSFYSDDLDYALHAANEALQLFQKIEDEKAIAIASNNLGNTLLALSVDRRTVGTCLCSDDGECCVKVALECYDNAVNAGTEDFQSVEADSEKCRFAQQLADRHFNRAMCLLLTADDPCSPESAKELAFADLHLAKQYDEGVKDFMLASKLLFRNSDTVFERSLRRLYGLSQLTKVDSDVWQIWDIYELVDFSDLMLQAAWNQPKAPLFQTMNRIGRLQQLEGAVANVECSSGNFKDAAVLSTRMLVEDEFIIESAFVEAADCLLRYTRETDAVHHWSKRSLSKFKQEIRQMRKSAKKGTLDIGRSYILCYDLSGEWNGTEFLEGLKSQCFTFYDENCLPTDLFGVVAFNPQDGDFHALRPNPKAQEEDAHRNAIESATTGVACSKFSPSITHALKMAIDTASSTATDVYLIYISDGRAWSEETFKPLQETIQKASRHSSASIDIITIGVEVKNSGFEESCKNLCLATRSRDSKYIAVSGNSIDQAFETVESMMNAGTSMDGNRLKQGLTMQKF